MLVRDGALCWRGARVAAVDESRLRGAHNLENALAAAAVTLARGIDPAAVRAALAVFAGVAHRLEEVARVDGVLYVNDSKATNVARRWSASARSPAECTRSSAAAASGRTTRRWPGGRRALRRRLPDRRGASGLRAALEPASVPLHDCGDLERAVAAAHGAASAGEVVLLSPACASYDQYGSYEERGERFSRALVSALA